MPLIKNNAKAVNLAIDLINKNKFPSFYLLTDHTFISSTVLQMEIIPKINAVGRITLSNEVNRLVKYFTCEDILIKKKIAEYLNLINEERKNFTKNAENDYPVSIEKASIFVITNLLEGVNGLLANKFLNKYHRPIAVFAPSHNDPTLFVGSLRSEEGFSIIDFLNNNSKLFIAYGGHEHAGGVSLRSDNLAIFEKQFEDYAKSHPLIKKEEILIPLETNECTMENLNLLFKFGPFGNENPLPKFMFSLPKSKLNYTKNGQFLSTKINDCSSLFSFVIKENNLVNENDIINFVVTMDYKEWKNNISLQLNAIEIKNLS